MKKIFFSLFLIISSLISNAQNFVQITNCDNNTSQFDFSKGGNLYRPLVCNYLIEFVEYPSGQWYISPNRQATSNGYSPSANQWMWDFESGNLAQSKITATAKLDTDLQKIKDLGFTEIRLVGIGLKNSGTSVNPTNNYPTGNQGTYFNLLDAFLNQVDAKGLKVIMLLGERSEYYQDQNVSYKSFISSVASHYANNTTVMAYDIFNEPDNKLWAKDKNDKFIFAKMINDWNNCIKKNDSNHLTTIGIINPLSVFSFDPMLLSVDFISYHLYPNNTFYSDYNKMKEEMNTYFYWWGKNIKMPWIIGEISYGANDPTKTHQGVPNLDTSTDPEANQVAFLNDSYKRSTDCNCKAYSWWKFQNSGMGPAFGVEDYQGLYYRHSSSGDWVPKKIANQTTSPFLSYANYQQNKDSCTMPDAYYTILAGDVFALNGYVKDENNVPIKDAIVTGKVNGMPYTTFTSGSGYFRLLTNGSPISELFISYPEYSNYYSTTLMNNVTYKLKKIYNNNWAKEWENATTTKLSNDWVFSSYDKFYKGDFDGDGKQDLLCIKYSNSSTTTDRMAIYSLSEQFTQYPIGNDYYYNLNTEWKLIWDKPTSAATEGIYPYRNNLTVGDFNGDGKDDIISINGGGGNWTSWFTFVPNSNPLSATWQFMDSNWGTQNDPSHPMSYMTYYNNTVVAGDFYGVGKDAIIGVVGNWITIFQIINGTWSWIQSNGGLQNNSTQGNELSYLFDYKNQLTAGDFDGDGTDEIFGNNNGNLAIFKATWSNPVWKWVNSSNNPYWYDPATSGSSGMQPYAGNLLVGNVDQDKNDEIIGISSSNCVNFNFSKASSAQSFSFSWDGGSYARISDWDIAPNAYKYVLLKTDQNAINEEKKLLGIRNNSGSWSAGLYAFRPNIRHYWPCSTARNADASEPTGINKDELESEINLYPNPSDGLFKLDFNNEINSKSISIQIFNTAGKMIDNYDYGINESEKSIWVNLKGTTPGLYFINISTKNRTYHKKIVIL